MSSSNSSSSSVLPLTPTSTPSTASASSLPRWTVPLTPSQCVYTSQYCEENSFKLAQQLLKRIPKDEPIPNETTSPSEQDETKSSDSSAAAVPAASPSAASIATSPLGLSADESIYPNLAGERVFVIFLSNFWNELRLYKQKIGDPARDGYVVWDYHVVVVVKPSLATIRQSCTCLETNSKTITPKPCPCAGYIYDLDTTEPFPAHLDSYARNAFRSHLAPPSTSHGPYQRLFRVIGARDFLLNFASDRRHMLVPPSLLDNVIRTKSEEGLVRFDDGITNRKEISAELEHQKAEQAAWSKSPVKDRLPAKDDEQASLASSMPLEYLAPPPPYPPIRSVHSRHNLDEYRFFTQPDSGRGVVMDESEFLEFFHVNIPRPKQSAKGKGRK